MDTWKLNVKKKPKYILIVVASLVNNINGANFLNLFAIILIKNTLIHTKIFKEIFSLL